ncbi:MAG TPA: glycosyltransferase family 2 protein [Candidatus Krumholzibacterium sp.]|nr:glycosyltransferase family 2 protein [Candidatus Krumholzibacterium sp.]
MNTKRTGMARVSLLVITLNEEDNISGCIASVPGAGEVVVIDSFSSDRTAEIAEAEGAAVYKREFISYSDQKNWGMGRCTGEWILILDADERLSSSLVEEIAVSVEDPDAAGFFLRRRSEFLGRRIRFCGWDRDRVLRLFRNGKGHYPERAVHEKLELDGSPGTLKGWVYHNPYRDLGDYLERMKSYSRLGAEEAGRRGRRWFPALILNPPARFIRMYLLQLGFLDGIAGLILCSLASTQVFLKYSFLREIYRDSRKRAK